MAAGGGVAGLGMAGRSGAGRDAGGNGVQHNATLRSSPLPQGPKGMVSLPGRPRAAGPPGGAPDGPGPGAGGGGSGGGDVVAPCEVPTEIAHALSPSDLLRAVQSRTRGICSASGRGSTSGRGSGPSSSQPTELVLESVLGEPIQYGCGLQMALARVWARQAAYTVGG